MKVDLVGARVEDAEHASKLEEMAEEFAEKNPNVVGTDMSVILGDKVYECRYNLLPGNVPGLNVKAVRKAPEKPKASSGNPSGGTPKLEDIKGIGPAMKRALMAAGVETVEALASIDRDRLVDIASDVRGTHDVAAWIAQAKDLTKS